MNSQAELDFNTCAEGEMGDLWGGRHMKHRPTWVDHMCLNLANECCRVRIGWMSPQRMLSLSVCGTPIITGLTTTLGPAHCRMSGLILAFQRGCIEPLMHFWTGITFFCNREEMWKTTAVKQENILTSKAFGTLYAVVFILVFFICNGVYNQCLPPA